MNIAICDDNQIFIDKLKNQLSEIRLFKDSNYTFCNNGKDLISSFNTGAPFEFVFLDVDMPEMNGIEAGKKINELSPKTIIIFVSNYPQFAIDAFDCNATSYLLKDYSQEKFDSTIQKAIDKYNNLNSQISLKTGNGMITLAPNEILYIEYSRKYCIYHTEDSAYAVRQQLHEAINQVQHFGFLQIYQCYIINLSKIKKIQVSNVTLINNVKLPVRRGFYDEVIKAYIKYIRRNV